jgi:hypothetical protein
MGNSIVYPRTGDCFVVIGREGGLQCYHQETADIHLGARIQQVLVARQPYGGKDCRPILRSYLLRGVRMNSITRLPKEDYLNPMKFGLTMQRHSAKSYLDSPVFERPEQMPSSQPDGIKRAPHPLCDTFRQFLAPELNSQPPRIPLHVPLTGPKIHEIGHKSD